MKSEIQRRRLLQSVAACGVILFVATACQREKSETAQEPADEIETDPVGFSAEAVQPPSTPEEQPPGGDPDSLSQNSFPVDPNFLRSVPSRGDVSGMTDPFFGSANFPGGPHRLSAREVLEAYGVVFGPGAGVFYDASGQLFVRNTPDQMDLVEAVLESLARGSEKQINVLVEIYQVPALVALKLEQSGSAEADHTPEREGVIRMIERGEASFVTSATLIARSGQRAYTEDVFERIYTDYREKDPEKKEGKTEPYFETRNIGTTLELDPVLGPDDKTIDLNFTLEHHSAPPTYRTLSARFAGSDHLYNIPAPEFHVKKITTQMTLLDGNIKMIGAWRPTGKPEFEANDLMQIAFLKADVQVLNDFRLVK